ncbi:hypothetical protein AVEN_253494-1 [Araneus ventricosus]|uniref:Uncharacterized protein n=1 Tax=Araneus ventricosus TaxID=182803 RepID=A0A4Y2BSH9_ARAVE|nr:hypothetical protein AVEN_253494-1 [Araneus ventricosus]
MEMSQTACHGWNPVWTEIGKKNQRHPERGSERNNALRRLKPHFEGSIDTNLLTLRKLKPRFEGSVNQNLLTGENRRAINKQCIEGKKIAPTTLVQS